MAPAVNQLTLSVMWYFIFSMLLVAALAMWLRPAVDDCVSVDPEPEPWYEPQTGDGPAFMWIERHPGRIKNKLFLFVFAWSILRLLRYLIKNVATRSQRTILSIRQALKTMWFGRGLLRG